MSGNTRTNYHSVAARDAASTTSGRSTRANVMAPDVAACVSRATAIESTICLYLATGWLCEPILAAQQQLGRRNPSVSDAAADAEDSL